MMDREKLRDAVAGKFVPIFMTSYADIKDYYQDKHGAKGWIGAMAQAVSGAETRSRKDKPYMAARRAVERFESGQNKSMKKYGTASKMEAIGKTLPPIGQKLPGNTITITIKGKQSDGSKGGREREFTATFNGPDAYIFAHNPTYKQFFKKLGFADGVIAGFDGGDSSGLEVTFLS